MDDNIVPLFDVTNMKRIFKFIILENYTYILPKDVSTFLFIALRSSKKNMF